MMPNNKKLMLFFFVAQNEEQGRFVLHQEIGYELNEISNNLFAHLKSDYPAAGNWKIAISGTMDVEKMLAKKSLTIVACIILKRASTRRI